MTVDKLELTDRGRWQEFCERMRVVEGGVPLFDTDGLMVRTMPHGRSGRLVIRRSPQMEECIRRETQKLTGTTAEAFDGLIYLMYTRSKVEPVPLYIGKAET